MTDTPALSDEAIRTAIESQAAQTDVQEVRGVLETIQESVENYWDTHMDAVEDGSMELVAIHHDGTLVFADRVGGFWRDEFSHEPLSDRDLPPKMRSVVEHLHHQLARDRVEFNWAQAAPVVVQAPELFAAGQRLVESQVLGWIARGLSPGQAWSVWGVLSGNSRNNWASRADYKSHAAVSNRVREAKEQLPLDHLE